MGRHGSSLVYFDMQQTDGATRYRLLTSSVVPRPIAWVSTCDRDGVVNLAPFSCFNLMSYEPVLVAIGIQAQPDGRSKDTLANIEATGELVVNLVMSDHGEAMSSTAAGVPSDVDEAVLAGIETEPSRRVRPPRVAGAPGSLECRTYQIIRPGPTQAIVLAEVLALNLRDELVIDPVRGHVDTPALALLGRMEGPGWYTRCGDRLQIDPPLVTAPAMKGTA